MKLRPSILFTSAASLIATTITASAVDYVWNTASGDWATAGNWAGGTVPTGGGGNFVYVNNGGTATISSTVGPIQDPFVGVDGGSGIVNQNTGVFNATAGWAFIGTRGAGSNGQWNVNGDATFNTGRIYLGGRRENDGGTGSMTVNTTGAVNASSDFSIGTRGGSGTLNVQSGTVNAASWMIIGESISGVGGSTGVVNQTGGVVSNGTADANGRFWMGSLENGASVASNATYNISGGTLNARNVAVGRHFGGTFNQNGGTVNFTSGQEATNLGQFAGSTGTYNISAGTLNTNGTFNVGDGGTGILNVSGTGVANVTGGDGLRVGSNGGSGTVNLTGGTLSANFVNRLTGAGQINLNGGTLQARSAQTNFFQNLSDAQIDVQAGGVTFDTNNNAVTITQNLAGAGGLTKAGNGKLTVSGAPTFAGNLTVTGGTLAVTGAAAHAGNSVVTGGTLSIGDGGTTGSLPATTVTVGAAGTLAFNRSDDITNSNTITGTGTVAKEGANTLTVSSGFSGFTGTVAVNGGKLVNTAAGDLATASVSVNASATLLPLGSAVGAINTAGFTAGTGSTLNFDFSAGGATYDQIVSSAGLNFAGAYTINLFEEGTANAFSTNGVYSLFDYVTSVSGSPSGFTIGNPVIGKSYQLADHGASTTLRMTIADAVLVAWANAGSGTWSTNTNWSPNITPNVATADVNFTSAITAPSTVDIDGNKVSGKLTFDNANSYTIGGTGTLTLDNGLAAGSIAVVTGNHFINTPVALPNATGVNTATGTTLQVGDVSGAGTITKSGNGTLVLNGTTGSTGGIIVNGGLVQVGTGGAGGALPSGNISLAAGTRVALNSTTNSTIAGNITGGGSISQDAAGVVTHTGTSTYTGFTDLNAGTFNNNGSITGTSNIDVNNTTNLGAGSTTTTTGDINVGTGGTVASAGTASFGGSLNINNGGSATISGGTVTQTNVGNSKGINVGTVGSGTLNISGGTTSNFDTVVGASGGSSGAINMSAGRLDTNQWSVIGDGGGSTGVVTQTGGTWNQNHTDWLSIGQRGNGTYTMSGNSVLNDQSVVDTSARGTNKGNVVIGRWTDGASGGVGVWNLTDTASARVRRIQVGDQALTNGTVNVGGTAAVVASEDIHIGQAGTGAINVNGGSVTTTTGWTQIGVDAGSNGSLNVASGTFYNREMRVGINGTGTLDISGGAVTANQVISLGLNPTGTGTLFARGTGTLTVDNGGISVGAANANAAGTGVGVFNVADTAVVNISNGGGLRVGGVGTGTYNQSGGTVNVGGNAIFGNGGPNAVTANVSGGSLAVNGELWVGQAANGNATLNISAGTVQANNWIAVGRETATGVINISGTGSLIKTGSNANHIVVGSLSGIGTINQESGSLITTGSGQVLLGENAGGSGTWNISGTGTANVDGIRVGWIGGGNGFLGISDTASINVGADGIIIGENGTGSIAQVGGTLTIGGNFDVQGNGTGTYSLAAGRVNVNGGIDTTNGTFNFGAGTLSRSNAGNIAITGPLTTLDAGATLKLDADKTFSISGALDDNTGLTLDVSGRGIPDGTYLGLPLTGSLNLGTIGGAVSPAGDAFDIAYASLLGFDNVFDVGSGPMTATRIDEDTPFNPASDSVYWVDEDAGVVTIQYNVVPEPSSVSLIIAGMAFLARRRRRD